MSDSKGQFWGAAVVIGGLGGVVTATLLGIFGMLKGELEDKQFDELVQDVAAQVVETNEHRAALIGAMKEDGRFDGRNGTNGIDVPIGSIVAWPGALPPEGSPWHERWHVCDGAELDRGDCAELIAAFGGSEGWPYGGGIDKVKLPDFRGMFLRGAGQLDADHGSDELGVRQPDQNLRHSHGFMRSDTEEVVAKPYLASGRLGGKTIVAGGGPESLAISKAEATIAAEGGSESRPVNYAVHWIIRVR